VHQRRGLESVPSLLGGQVMRRQPAQIAIDQGGDSVEGCLVTVAPLLQTRK